MLPLGMKRLDLIEMPGHIALMALGQPWENDSHYADLCAAVDLGCRISDDEHIKELCAIGRQLLLDNSTDYPRIRQVIGPVLQWISQQPNKRIHDAALSRLKEYDESKRVS